MDFDGDDTMVGAEELQLLQQMSQQMIQVSGNHFDQSLRIAQHL
jgi:hypothetical protein